jgi:lysophospholipase L1-like esterase
MTNNNIINKIKILSIFLTLCLMLVPNIVTADPHVTFNYPANGTSTEHLEVSFQSVATNATYVIPDINSSIVGIYSFETGARNASRHGNLKNFSASAIALAGTVNSIYGKGIEVNNSFTSTGNPTLSTDGFALAFDLWFNDTNDTAILNSNFVNFYSANYGFTGWLSNFVNYLGTENFTQIQFNIYNGTNYNGNTAFRIYYHDITTLRSQHRVLLNLDLKNGYAQTWLDGNLVYTDSVITPYGYYKSAQTIGFSKTTEKHRRFMDEVVIINRSLNNLEASLYSQYQDNITMEFETYVDTGDYLFNLRALGYGPSLLNKTEIRYYENLESPQIEISKMFPDYNGTSINLGTVFNLTCRGDFGEVSNYNINNTIQYSTDTDSNDNITNSTWTNLSTTWQIPEEYAILGDSMSYVMTTGFWPYYFANLTNVSTTNFNNRAVSGKNCQYAYNALLVNVTNTTDVLFITCGVNSFATSNNTYWWNLIYNESKAKGIREIYMTTMPPWDYINDQPLVNAIVLCTKQKAENSWLLNFDTTHSDLKVYDLWTDWHDTSGLNLTDCGWRTDQVLSGDGVHPNSIAARYWAEKHWYNFNEWVANTSMTTFTAPSLTQNMNYTFRCFSDYNTRTSLISTIGTLTVRLDPSTIPEPEMTIGDNANNTVAIVGAAFGLIAIMIIAASGYIFFQVLKGEMDLMSVGTLAVAAVAVAVILIIGYYILGTLAASIA